MVPSLVSFTVGQEPEALAEGEPIHVMVSLCLLLTNPGYKCGIELCQHYPESIMDQVALKAW